MADNDHTCTQEAKIAVLEANTAQQGKDIADIKQELKDLNTKVDKNHEEMNSELKLIRNDVADIKTSIVAQSAKIDTLTDTVAESVKHLGTLDNKVSDMDKTVTIHTNQIDTLMSTTSDHGARLVKVEKKIWKIVAYIGAAIFILQLISTMSSCADLKHFVKELFIEEQSGQSIQ